MTLANQHTRVSQLMVEASDLVAQLTPREREILSLVTRGYSSKSAARVLDLSPRTVDVHRANAFSKINARSTADAVRVGVYAQLDLED